VALGTRQVGLVEKNRSPVHITALPRGLSQRGGRFLLQLLFQRSR
jgi:hypothetical protein